MTTTVFPALRTTDAAATIALLVTLGFTERVVIRNEQDPELVEHAEYALGDTGGIMFGSVRNDGSALDAVGRSEEHTSELQSRGHLVCRLLLEKKKMKKKQNLNDTV